MENYDTYKQAISEAEKAEGTAARKMQAYNESVAYSINQLSAAWEGFTQKLEASGAVKTFFTGLTAIIENLDHILQYLMPVIATFNADKIISLAKFLSPLVTTPLKAIRHPIDTVGKSKGAFYENMTQKMTAENTSAMKELTNALRDNAAAVRGERPKSGAYGVGHQSGTTGKGVRGKKGFNNIPTIPTDGTLNTSQYTPEQIDLKVQSYDSAISDAKQNGTNEKVIKQLEKKRERLLKIKSKMTSVIPYDPNIQKAAEEERTKLEAQKKAERKTRLKTGAVAGLAAGAARFANRGSSFLDNFGIFKGTGDVEVSDGEAAAMGGIQAILTASLTAWLGPLGTVLATFGGDFLSSLWKKLAHADEIARKERVQQAKDNLEAIKGISASVTGLIDIRKKGDYTLWDADDWKQVNNYIDSINKAAAKSKSFSEAIGGAITNIEKLTEAQLANIEAARIEYEARQTYAAGEQDRYTLQQQILENQKKLNDADEKVVSQARAAIKSATAELKEYTDALNKSMLESAFYSSGVSSMRSSEISGAAIERVIMEIAREWESKGVGNVFYGSGQITSTAYSDILSFIRQQSGYESLLKNESRDIFEVKQSLALFDGNEEAVKRLQELAKNKNLDSLKKALQEFGYTSEQLSNNTVLNNIIDKIFNADTNSIATVAHGIGMTIEEFEEANRDGSFDWLTSGDILNGADKFLEKMTGISEIFKDLAEDSKLSAENIKKVTSSYKFLLRGEGGQMSTDNILSNIGKMLSQGVDSEAGRAYIGMKQMELMQDSDIWKIFVQDETVTGNLDENIKKQLVAAKTYSDVESLMSENAELYEKFWSFAGGFVEEFDLYDEIRKTLIEYQTNVYDNEISNLQSIKDSLSDINKQREREIELIKAKEALENASKEKKRVYRAGVGFVYTSDQEAIKSAQDKVDELETQQKQDDIQYQIDTLEQQKSILENIENNKQLAALQKTVGDIFTEQGENAKNIVDAILATTDDDTKKEFYEMVGAGKKEDDPTAKWAKDRLGAIQKEKEAQEQDEAVAAYNAAYKEYEDNFLGNNAVKPGDIRYDDYYKQRKAKEEQLTSLASKVTDKKKIQSFDPIDPDSKYDIYGVKSISVGNKNYDIYPSQELANEDAVNKEFAMVEGTAGAGHNKNAEYLIYKYSDLDQRYVVDRKFNTDKGMTYAQIGNALKPGEVLVLNRTPWGTWDFGVYKDYDGQLRYLGQSGHIDYNFEVGNLTDEVDDVYTQIIGGKSFDNVKSDVENIQKKYGKEATAQAFKDKFETLGTFMDASLSPYWEWLIELQTFVGSYASGTLSAHGGPSLINENGLESIITPDGTITSLPAKTGIVPADLTRNLWTLGEVAPNLIARLGGSNLQTNNANSSTDNSINIQNLDATFNTQEGFDGAKFIQDLRSRIILTRNNH